MMTSQDGIKSAQGHPKLRHDRSGIALVIVLGFLTLLTILAVSFSISMRTERLSSSLYIHSVQARHLAHAAVARAMAAVEDDPVHGLSWIYHTTNGVERYIDTPMAPRWVTMPSGGGTGDVVNLLAGTVTDYLPRIALTNALAAGQEARWEPIEVDGMVIGRVAYLVADCSGFVDITQVGKRDRADPQGWMKDPRGIRLDPALLANFSSALRVDEFQQAMENEWIQIESLAELRRVPGFAGSPREAFFYSYAPNHEWYDTYHQIVRPRVVIGTNEASAVANQDDIIWSIRQLAYDNDRRTTTAGNRPRIPQAAEFSDGNTDSNYPSDADAFFSNYLDYLDEDWIPRLDDQGLPRNFNTEPVPRISEIIFTNHVIAEVTGENTATWENRLDVVVEMVFPFPIFDNNNTYSLEANLRTIIGDLRLSGQQTIQMPGPWYPNEYRIWENRFRFSVGPQHGMLRASWPIYVLTLTVRDPDGTVVGVAENITMRASDVLKSVGTLAAPLDVRDVASKTPRSITLGIFANWRDSQYELRQTSGPPWPPNHDDWTDIITPGRFNRKGFLEEGDSNGLHTILLHSRSQDRIDHVGEWHRMITAAFNSGGTRSFNFRDGRTVGNFGAGTRSYRCYQEFDRWTVSTNIPPRGTINPNTMHRDVFATALVGMRLDSFTGINGILDMALIDPSNPDDRFRLNEDVILSTASAQRLADKLMFDRDYEYEVYLHPHLLRTTVQNYGWTDWITRPRMMHFMRWSPNSNPHVFHWHNAVPFNQSPWFTPPPRSLTIGAAILEQTPGTGPRPPGHEHRIEAIRAEGWSWYGLLGGHFAELFNPRQNLFTIVVAAQTIMPRSVASVAADPIGPDDVMSERRALLVVWRDPWPTPPADYQPRNLSRGYDPYDAADNPYPPPSERTHKAFVRFFKWLDE